MGFFKFLISKHFFISIIAMILIVVGLCFYMLSWLESTTNHGQEVFVPTLQKVHYTKLEKKLKNYDLDYEIIDSVDFRKDFPPLSVVEQDPEFGERVKKGRKIYVKLNSSSYAKVELPDLIQVSYRQAIPTLKSLGLKEGKITYKANIGKDMVLEMRCNGKKLKPGDRVTKTAKIDLVLGNGMMGVQRDPNDDLIDNLVKQYNEEK